MKPLEQLKSMLNTEYETEDGDTFKIELLDGMNDYEIKNLQSKLPQNTIPFEIEELIRYTRGFEFAGLDTIRFDAVGEFGFENYFPYTITLGGDGCGNFWIVDIGGGGDWREVYYVCHDPPVIVKHSTNLTEFIHHLDEFGKLGNESNLNIIHDKITLDIYHNKKNVVERDMDAYNFPSDIANELPKVFTVADLEGEPIQTGFNWAKYGLNNRVIRLGDRPIWIIEKDVKQTFWGVVELSL